MIAVNYNDLTNNINKYYDAVSKDFETLIVTIENKDNVVILSEIEYNNMLENLYLMGNKNNYARLLEGLEQMKKGEFQVRELLPVE